MAYEIVLTALADPTRRHILETLRHAPHSVGEIAARQSVSRPAVSQHLRVLEQARLVTVQKRGTRRYYHVQSQGLRDLRHYIDGFWDDVLTAFSDHVETRSGENHEQSD